MFVNLTHMYVQNHIVIFNDIYAQPILKYAQPILKYNYY